MESHDEKVERDVELLGNSFTTTFWGIGSNAHTVYVWKAKDGTYEAQCKACPWTHHGLDDEVCAEDVARRHAGGSKRCR